MNKIIISLVLLVVCASAYSTASYEEKANTGTYTDEETYFLSTWVLQAYIANGAYVDAEYECNMAMNYENISKEDYEGLCLIRAFALYNLGKYEKAVYYADQVSQDNNEWYEKAQRIIEKSMYQIVNGEYCV